MCHYLTSAKTLVAAYLRGGLVGLLERYANKNDW